MNSSHSTDRRGNLAKMKTIMRREFVSRVKTKGFVIGTIMMPIFLLAVTIIPAVLVGKSSDRTRVVGVLDLTGEIFPHLQEILNGKTASGDLRFKLVPVTLENGDLQFTRRILEERIHAEDLYYYLIIPPEVFETNRAEIYGEVTTNFHDNSEIQSALSRSVADRRLTRRGFDPDSVRVLMSGIELATYKVGSEDEQDDDWTWGVAWIMVLSIYMAVIIYGAIIMRSVLEEKTSRVIESVISAVKPFYLMTGKILGVGAVGLLQFLIWAVAASLISLYGAAMVSMFSGSAASSFQSIEPAILIYCVVFFLLGYLFYSTLYAGIGAVVNSDQDAQQMASPLVLMLIIPMMIIWNIVADPDGPTAIVFSLVPFFSPMVMLVRIILKTPPAWEIAASIAILIFSLFVNLWIVGKIFRVGVLMYGKRPTVPELVRWLRRS